MKKVWEKVKIALFWRPDMKLTAVMAVLAMLLLIVPLLRISLYTVPWYDDYNYGKFVKSFLDLEYSLRSALQGAEYCVKTQWYAWQGTFSSIFFMCMGPFVWDTSYYYLGSIFLIVILPFSVYVLTGVLLRSVLKAERSCSMILQAAAVAMVIVFIHSDRAGFYWYNSGIHYVGMHSFLLLTAAAWIKLLSGKKIWSTIPLLLWTIVGAVLSGGANFVTALQGLMLVASIMALCALLRNKRCLLLLPSVIVYGYAFYKNVSAPGNHVRGAFFDGLDVVPAILRSFSEGVLHIWEFTGLRMLAVMILILPVIWHMVKKLEFKFRYPGMILFWSFCFYATGFAPSLYSMGHAGLGRTLNAVKITWQLLVLLNEVYWLGWLQQKALQSGKAGNAEERKGVPVLYYLAVGALMFGIFMADPYQAAHYSTFSAYYYVHSGEAFEFYKEYLARIETIQNGGDVIEVTPYHFTPAPICVSDLSSDPNREENRSMASWYGKQAIICKSMDSE